MRSKRILIVALSTIGFFLLTILLIIFVFPNVSLKHLIEKSVEKQLKYSQSVKIGDIRLSPLGNLRARDVLVVPRVHEKPDPNLAVEGGVFDGFFCAPMVGEDPFAVAELHVMPSILSFLKKSPRAKFDLALRRNDGEELGSIQGVLDSKSGLYKVDLSAHELSLNELTLLSNFIKVQLHGALDLSTHVITDKSGRLLDLNFEMNSTNTVMCPKRLKLNMGGVPFIELPFTRFGNIEAQLSLGDDQAIIVEKFKTDGPDLSISVTGKLWPKSKPNAETRVDLNMVIHPGDEWMEENSMEIIYRVCRKQADGSIELHLSGAGKAIRKDCGTPIIEAAPAMAKTDNSTEDSENSAPEPQDDLVAPAPKAPQNTAKNEVRQGVRRPPPKGRAIERRGERNELPSEVPLNDIERRMLEGSPELRQAVINTHMEAEKARESRGIRRERPIGAQPGRKAISEP
ncbi:MAG: type II secretion system protein GspN [Bradymonadales bacterium]|jgi:type II secretion system protein N